MTATFSLAELRQQGYELKDGRLVRVRKPQEAVAESQAIGVEESPYKSKWEEQFAAHLEWQRRANMILAWEYEAVRLRLADGAWYKPDFLVRHTSGQLELIEVKGHWREAARVRWKVAHEKFSRYFRMSVWSKVGGQWVNISLWG